VLGPVDRALGFGFGALKGLILASLVFLVVALMVDTVSGGPARRPDWMVKSRTYKLLNATSAGIADFVDRRRRGFLSSARPPRPPPQTARRRHDRPPLQCRNPAADHRHPA
jgi:membrane protein required for colicin V production